MVPMDNSERSNRLAAIGSQIDALSALNRRFHTGYTNLSEVVKHGRRPGEQAALTDEELRTYNELNRLANDAKHHGLGAEGVPERGKGGSPEGTVSNLQGPISQQERSLENCIGELERVLAVHLGRPLTKNEPRYCFVRRPNSLGPYTAIVCLDALAKPVQLIGDSFTKCQTARHSAALQGVNWVQGLGGAATCSQNRVASRGGNGDADSNYAAAGKGKYQDTDAGTSGPGKTEEKRVGKGGATKIQGNHAGEAGADENRDAAVGRGGAGENRGNYARKGGAVKNQDTGAGKGCAVKNQDTGAGKGCAVKNQDMAVDKGGAGENRGSHARKGGAVKNQDTAAGKGGAIKHRQTDDRKGGAVKHRQPDDGKGGAGKQQATDAGRGAAVKYRGTAGGEDGAGQAEGKMLGRGGAGKTQGTGVSAQRQVKAEPGVPSAGASSIVAQAQSAAELPSDAAVLAVLGTEPLRVREIFLLALGRDPKKEQMGADVRSRFTRQLRALERSGSVRQVQGKGEWAAV